MALVSGQIVTQQIKAEVWPGAEVVVAGGGTAGVVAALAAARAGAKVLLVERYSYLGGMMTAGNAGLTKYLVHDRNQNEYRQVVAKLAEEPAEVQVVGGLPLELTDRLIRSGIGIATGGRAGSYVFTDQAQFKFMLMDLLAEAGVEVLLYAPVVDVLTTEGRIEGLAVETKQGRKLIPGKIFIDATGDADVAAAAGVPFTLGIGPEDLAAAEGAPLGTMQNPGVMFRMGNIDFARTLEYMRDHPEQFIIQHFALMSLKDCREAFARGEMMTMNIGGIGHQFQIYNTPIPGVFTFCCPQCPANGLSSPELTGAVQDQIRQVRERIGQMRSKLPGFEQASLLDFPDIGVRETRRIHGEYCLNAEDVMYSRHFPDCIGKGCHPCDSYPRPKWINEFVYPRHWSFEIPYRTLVPQKIDNLLVAGRCISSTHEAFGCIRPTVQCMITGEAAGMAAALCLAEQTSPRQLDPQHLREKLLEQGVCC